MLCIPVILVLKFVYNRKVCCNLCLLSWVWNDCRLPLNKALHLYQVERHRKCWEIRWQLIKNTHKIHNTNSDTLRKDDDPTSLIFWPWFHTELAFCRLGAWKFHRISREAVCWSFVLFFLIISHHLSKWLGCWPIAQVRVPAFFPFS